jgi:hypothetical protein
MNLQNLIEEMEEFSHCEILAEENHTFTEVTDLWKSAIQALRGLSSIERESKDGGRAECMVEIGRRIKKTAGHGTAGGGRFLCTEE